MNEKVFGVYQQRIERILEKLPPYFYRDAAAVEAEYAVSTNPVPFKNRLALHYESIEEGEAWGRNWQSAWFHFRTSVPESFAGKELCWEISLGGEALIFDAGGTPVYGLTGGSVFSGDFYKDRFTIGSGHRAGEKLELWVEAAANQLFGLDRSPEHPFGQFVGTARIMRLCVFDRELWSFHLDLSVAYSLAKTIGFGDYRALQIMDAMNRAADLYGDNPENAAKARTALKEILGRRALDSAPVAYSVGHAHIDVGWLWPVRESIRKAARTFSSQLANMRKYPDYKFGASQAELYEMVRTHYPALFRKIQKRVAEGRWEIQGGMWVEADCNITSGESLVRQFLHGKNYFFDHFGVDVKNLWIPDVFGYSASMPQIIRKCGCDTFLTQKISWSQINKFPHTTFRWRGVDGSEVLTHFPPENSYNALVTPAERIRGQNNFQETALLDGFMSLFGIGDGGGGPTEEFIERGLRMRDLEGCPKHRFERADVYFSQIAEKAGELPVWEGELYLEFHRGTLTTQARTKRGNRGCEQALTELEFLSSCLPPAEYPAKELDKLWKKLLVNQFHDILPGSSITMVNENTRAELADVLKTAKALTLRSAEKLFLPDAESLTLVNTLSCESSEAVVLPESWNGFSAVTADGKKLPAQSENGETTVLVKIPGGSFLTLRKVPKAPVRAKGKSKTLVLENKFIRYEFHPDGTLASAFDREEKREVLSGPGNKLEIYNDLPNNYDAWDVDLFYRKDSLGQPECVSAEKLFEGPVRSAVAFRFRFGKSEIVQRAILRADSKRLDFVTEADWREEHKMLRTAFPVTVSSGEAAFDIQYAYLKRSTHDNTSWDLAKFEVCGQRYADLSSDDYGAALLNDCKYGYSVKGSVLDLNLLRSPREPDCAADFGRHEFTYSFLPHAGTLEESSVMRESASLNRPPFPVDGFAAGKAAAPVRLESEGISLEVVKKAEKDSSTILRLVETKGRHSTGRLLLRNPKVTVSETNLIEWEHGPKSEVSKGVLNLAMTPFEIRTLRLENV